MMKRKSPMFPINIKIGQIQGVISVLKEHGGDISLQELSDESFLQVDDLVNILDACKALGLLKIKKEDVRLDRKVIKEEQHEITDRIGMTLRKIEPFALIIKEIKKRHGISTTELFHELISRGLINYRDNISGIKTFKRDLLITGLRLKILSYNHEDDMWHLAKK